MYENAKSLFTYNLKYTICICWPLFKPVYGLDVGTLLLFLRYYITALFNFNL